MDYIMETVGLRKAYKDNIVVDDVNMHISKGAIYGFVGPNGAGKSTVMKMILSLIQPDAGEVQLLGEKVTSHSYEIFKKVGSIIENPYFYDKMTARQNLELHCEYMGFPNKERIDEVLHLVDLQNVEKKQVCHYSLGMKQRLAIARAILAKPEFLILDEPINALDPEGIREMRTLFQRLNQEDGTTIFISSHILSEVDLLADTIGIIQHGKLLTELPIEEIHKHQTDYISLQVETVVLLSQLKQKPDDYINVTIELDDVDITPVETKATYDEIKKYVAEHNAGMKVSDLYISQVKRKCGIEVGKNYNLPKNEGSRQPQCPEDKERAIVEALEHFKMIQQE